MALFKVLIVTMFALAVHFLPECSAQEDELLGCLKVKPENIIPIMENIICLHNASFSTIPPWSPVTVTHPHQGDSTYDQAAQDSHSEFSIAGNLSRVYRNLTLAYSAGLRYCYFRGASSDCFSTEEETDACFNQCAVLLNLTRKVIFQMRRLALGFHCPEEECTVPSSLNSTAGQPAYNVGSVTEFAGRVANATSDMYYTLIAYVSYTVKNMSDKPSDYNDSPQFDKLCYPDGLPIRLPSCQQVVM